ncbi:hypothetical protein K503DRAFT_785827, partial [Rhizopogon vinicolor AM-OR11-026]
MTQLRTGYEGKRDALGPILCPSSLDLDSFCKQSDFERAGHSQYPINARHTPQEETSLPFLRMHRNNAIDLSHTGRRSSPSTSICKLEGEARGDGGGSGVMETVARRYTRLRVIWVMVRRWALEMWRVQKWCLTKLDERRR